MSSSAELKAQGNTFFIAKSFDEADKKYTEAVAAGDATTDPKGLAVIYANRAACRLHLKRYLDANDDAKMATQLNSTYAKAFARLATAQDALGDYAMSKESWQRALDALPVSDLKPGEKIQQEQYRVGLNAAADRLVKKQNVVIVQGEGRMPWDLAAAVLHRLRAEDPVNHISSAWIIHGAHEEFMNGVKKTNDLRIAKVNGVEEMDGIPGAMANITNGIMRDPRVLYFIDTEFATKLNKQIAFETTVHKVRTWVGGGPELVIREALARQHNEGWDAARGSVELVIRLWIMGAADATVLEQHDVAAKFLKHALDVVRSLCESWILVPSQDRGVVFDKTFLFGLQNMYINAVMQEYTAKPSPELLEELEKESDLVIREVDEAVRQITSDGEGTEGPGRALSCYIYPRAFGFAMKGFCYIKKAEFDPNKEESYRMAVFAYTQAAGSFPSDDEHCCWFMHIALKNMFLARSFPLSEILDLMQRIRAAVPKAKEIWEHSSLSAAGLWDILEDVGKQEGELRSLLEQGKFTLDQCIGIQTL